MKKPTYHILVCNSYRTTGTTQGACNKVGSTDLLQYLTEEASSRGLDVVISTTACLNLCQHKPVIVIQPNNYWYGKVTHDAVDEILDALKEGKPVEKYLIYQ